MARDCPDIYQPRNQHSALWVLGFSNLVVKSGISRHEFLGRHSHSSPLVLMSSKNPALWKPTLKRIGMNYKGFTLHSVVPRPGSMVTLEKPSLIGGNYIQSIYAKKPQPIVLKKKKW